MADTVSTNVLSNTAKRITVQILNISDGTGENAVTKIDKSTLVGLNGLEPGSLVLERVEGDASGMEVLVYCARTTPIELARIGGLGIYKANYRDVGGIQTNTAGSTGDILVTTNGQSAGDSYDIKLYFRKKN
jgi:hypothetical protein